ncbi:MAG: VWA domain-containing protein [Thermodesulfobacteriota bacterium]|nr:VWA domain-containing protein [Thermodesulfobacteriota bacterium]
MVSMVMDFASCLRTGGQRISTSEVLDCVHHLELIDVLDESQFRAVLRSNFAKSRREQSRFDQTYNLFFHELHLNTNLAQIDSMADKTEEMLKMLNEQANDDPVKGAIIDFLSGRPRAFLGEIRQLETTDQDNSLAPKKFNLAPLTERLEILVGINRIRDMVREILETSPSAFGSQEKDQLYAHFNGRLESAFRILTHEPRPHNEGLRLIKAHEKHVGTLGQKAFSALTPQEIEEMRGVIDGLVRKLKDIVTLRYSRKSRGLLDVKKTLHLANRYNGIPVEIAFRKRPPRKAKIVTLCDVSSSVWSAARFMLGILYSLQDCFSKVKSFVFVSDLDEVTKIFEEHEVNYAIEKVLNEADIDYQASTDYGATFRQFRSEYMDILNHKTTLIIVGDARSNYFNPEAEILSEMREHCRRVIWLNPDPISTWYTGDSEMSTYRPYLNELRPCRNLNELISFIEDLVL